MAQSTSADGTRRRREGGFSLLEALVAASFLGFSLLAFNAASLTLTRGTKTADSTSAANAMAQQRLELMRSMPLGHASHTSGNYDSASNPMTADGLPGGIFNESWVVSAPDTPDFGLKTVVVTVSWNDPLPHQTQLAGFVRCSVVPCP
jgi:type II secretory pathway pseudopilin PulG